MKTRKNRLNPTKRTVLCRDSIKWLQDQKNLDSIVTSIPEMDELNLNYDDYIIFLEMQLNSVCRQLRILGIQSSCKQIENIRDLLINHILSLMKLLN